MRTPDAEGVKLNSPGSGGPTPGRRNSGLYDKQTDNLRINPCKGSASNRRLVPWLLFLAISRMGRLTVRGRVNSTSAVYWNRGIGHENTRTRRTTKNYDFIYLGQYEMVVLREASIFRTYGALMCHATLLPNGHRIAAAMGYGHGAPPVL